MSPFGSAVSSAGRASLAAGLCLLLCACATRAADPQQAASRIDSLLSQEYPAGEPGAAVLVARGGTVILKKAYGLADTERQAPVTPQTVFRLASVTKMFTGPAILMLAEQNRLALDDPVARILPDSPASAQITVRHLLSHTAGLADYLDRSRKEILPMETPGQRNQSNGTLSISRKASSARHRRLPPPEIPPVGLVREEIRKRHYSRRTARTHVTWIRRFVFDSPGGAGSISRFCLDAGLVEFSLYCKLAASMRAEA